MRSIATIISVFFLFALVNGCGLKKSIEKVPSPSDLIKKIRPSQTDITEKSPSPTDLVNQYIASASQFENKGDLIKAFEQYQLVLTVDNKNQLATEKINQLQMAFKEKAKEHYSNGVSFYKKGKYIDARREFLIVLRYDPDHSQALKMLKEQKLYVQEVEGYLVHKIQNDDTVSVLAKKYYGDSRKFQIIAEYNHMDDATKIRLGQEIKIPVINGLFFFKSPEEMITLSSEIPESELTNVINVKNEIIHIVQPGESLTALAKHYFGDIIYYSMLAQYNQLSEDASLKVGKEIKIPEIAGRLLVEKSEGTAEPETEKTLEKPVAIVNTIADNRAYGLELFEAKKFEDAIKIFTEILDEDPDDSVSLEYISSSHFQQGLISFGKEEYLPARDEFQRSLQYNKNCQKCGEYIKECEETYMDTHYKKGLVHFSNEKLEEAAKEWKLVYDIDPEYKDVANSLKKVQSLIERLEGIKRSTMEEDKQ